MKDAGIATIALFELRNRLGLISTYVYMLLFAALGALFMAAAGGAFDSVNVVMDSAKVLINSPYAISQSVTVIGFLGVIVMAALMGRTVQQDFEYQTSAFFFTSPIAKRSYFFGRFFGGVLAMLVVYLGVAAGLLTGVHWPGVDPSRLGPFAARQFVEPYAFNILPNTLFLGAWFFGLAALTRRMLPVYVMGVLVFAGYFLAGQLMRDIENYTLAALVDPTGSTAQGVLTRYWSVAEKNTAYVPLEGVLLWNRLLWLSLGAAALAFCYLRFSMSHGGETGKAEKAGAEGEAPAAAPAALRSAARLDTSAAAYLRQLGGATAMQLRETFKNVYFGVILLTGVLFVFVYAWDLGSFFGTNTYPVTYQMLDVTSGVFSLFVLIITAIYAGELVWRERDARVDEILDSLPAPAWLGFATKLVTLFTLQALLMAVVFVCTVLLQALKGYFNFELGHSLYELFALQLPTYWIVAAMALATHVIVNHKYAAHALVIVYFAIRPRLAAVGLDHNLYLLAGTPSITYSDMNGYGHFVPAVRWFQLYWAAIAALLLLAAYLFWVRGRESAWRARWAIARGRLAGPISAAMIATAFLAVGAGGWIFYNTNVLNPYRSQHDEQLRQAEYEKRFKAFENTAQPVMTSARLFAELFPQEQRARLHGSYDLLNTSDQPIKALYVNLPSRATIARLEAEMPSKRVSSEADLEWHVIELDAPLAPRATTRFHFDLEYAARGFGNNGADRMVVQNGTSFVNDVLPSFGYDSDRELVTDKDRKKFDLAPRERMRDLDDAAGRMRLWSVPSVGWAEFHTTVSTDQDQIAISPGYLQREWVESGRRHFEYKSDGRILSLYSFNSGRYEVRRDRWDNGKGGVPLEIYYHAGHEYNLDKMLESTKVSLDYCAKNFSPYQHRQVRILEFPRYQYYAQSLANTIPYSEGIGFIAKVDPDDPKDIDYPYYVTAHEIAHQWWGHQVFGAHVQGQSVMTETLAQYTALMVMKQTYGAEKMKRFLRYELDRYLIGRGTEQKKEQPLFRTEGQPYIHYQKGSLAMYALQDAIGEDAVNRALAGFLRKWAFKDAPFPTTRDLIAEFRAVAPADQQNLITDLFEKITLYENRAKEARYRKLDDGRYAVELVVLARKLHADGDGLEQEAAMDDWVDVGVLDENDQPLLLEKRRLGTGETKIELIVDQLPAKAGIDPLNILVDRQPSDNVMPVAPV